MNVECRFTWLKTPKPLKHPFAFLSVPKARHDSIKMSMDAGDLDFRARSTLVLEQGAFLRAFTKQIELEATRSRELRKALPSAGMQLKAGKQNPVSCSWQLRIFLLMIFCVAFRHYPTRYPMGVLLYMVAYGLLQLDTISSLSAELLHA